MPLYTQPHELPEHEFLGEEVRAELIYFPTVTREAFRNQGRITTLIDNGKLCDDVGLPPLNPQRDRVMLCGSPAMLDELTDARCTRFRGLAAAGRTGRLRDRARVRALRDD